MRAHKTSAGCGFWCGVLLACAVSGIASARMIGGRNTLAVPTEDDFKPSRGAVAAAGIAGSDEPSPLQVSQEEVEEALVGGVKSGSIHDALKKYVDRTQPILDRFCMAQIDRSEAGRDIAALVMGALSDGGVLEELENDESVAEFFSVIGSPAADLGLFNNLLWLFSSPVFPIENFCLETTSAGMPAAHDVAGAVNQVIDTIFTEDNMELIGKVIKAGLVRLSDLYSKACSEDMSGAKLADGLYSILEDFMAISPDVERTVLDAVPFLLPGKPAVTKADIKDTLSFLFTSGVVPLEQICAAFGTKGEEREIAPAAEKSEEMMAPVAVEEIEEREVVEEKNEEMMAPVAVEEIEEMMAPVIEEIEEMMAPVVVEEKEPVGCDAVDAACPFSSLDITQSKDLANIMPAVCASPACVEAITTSRCFWEDVTRYVVDGCTCYAALTPECRDAAWVDTPKAAMGVYAITQEIGSGKMSLSADGAFLEALESSSTSYCPSENGTAPFCMAQASSVPQCSSFIPGGSDGPNWDELCCAAPLLGDETCRDFVNFLGNGEAFSEVIGSKMEDMMDMLFNSEQSPAARAETMKLEFGVETFGGALQKALSSGCGVLGALDKEAARTCMPKMECMTKKALGPAGQYLDVTGQIDTLLEMTEAVCGEGCISTVLGECFDAPLEPYLSFLDTVMSDPEALMGSLGMAEGGQMDWGFIQGLMPLLEPLCSGKCQASIDSCEDPLMQELGLKEMGGAMAGMCGLMKFLGPAGAAAALP